MLRQNILKVQQVMCVSLRAKHKQRRVKKCENSHNLNVSKPKDAPIDNPPNKLWRVQRIKQIKGTPYWERTILANLKLDQNMSDFAVVKNIPEVNAMLLTVKHLVDVKPIVFPYGEPTMNDINHTFLKENGECIVSKEIAIDEGRMQARDEFDTRQERLDGKTLARDSRMKWLGGYEKL